MSVQAMTWAIGCRTGSEGLKNLLSMLGNHAHADGTAAFPHVTTLADEMEVSERTVQRRIPELLDEGFIRFGDQELVAHIRADKRPIVYDLAMSEATRRQWKSDYEASPRGDNLSPRDADPTPDSGVTSCHPAESERGDTGDTSPIDHGVTPVTPRGDNDDTTYKEEQSLNSPHTPHGSRAAGTSPRQLARQTERDAADDRRRRSAAAIQADRRRKAETANVDAAARAAEARKLLHKAVSHG